MTYLGIRERRIGAVSILDADAEIRIALKFGARVITLSKAVESLLEDGRDQILVNLEQVPSISSRGLTELVSAAAAINRKGGRFKLAHLNETVLQIIKKAQLLTYLDVFDVESQAVDSFTAGLLQVSRSKVLQ
jgi:anti-anti-sigma factor